MKTKHANASEQWNRLGGPQAGTISALAVGEDDGITVFIGTKVGLYRSDGFDGTSVQGWERLSTAPIGIMSLAVSPDFAVDHLLMAGTESGIFLSHDAGDTWRLAQMPMQKSMVLSICFSPDFTNDSIIVAGTLEDGVIYSDSRGESWSLKSFGMLDATVYGLALSPNFAQDETIYAGTDTAIYFSYNQGRAWKPVNFPESAAPILSLAISPLFALDQTVYAGTETQGLYRSKDQGETWEKTALPATSINAMAVSHDQYLFAATESGIFESKDQGETWIRLVDIPDAISLAQKDDLVMAGLVEHGIWMTNNLIDWKPVSIPSIRTMVGMALSSKFDKDHMAFMYGPQEGVWRTEDGGCTWKCINPPDSGRVNETLPSLDIQCLILSPEFIQNHTVLATSTDGIFLSQDGGDRWQIMVEQPAGLASFSPNGKIIMVDFPGEGILESKDAGRTWVPVPGPWRAGGRVVALAVTNESHIFAALLEGVEDTLAIWQGKPGQLEKVISSPTTPNPVVSFWMPTEAAADRPWYASVGDKVWKFSARAGRPYTQSRLLVEMAQPVNILALLGFQDSVGQTLFACTGQHVYRSMDEKTWKLAADFGNEQALGLVLSPSYAIQKTVYALLLGGSMVKGVIR
jgi:photosystem II stability/assembly factor-like uncharacterized protein